MTNEPERNTLQQAMDNVDAAEKADATDTGNWVVPGDGVQSLNLSEAELAGAVADTRQRATHTSGLEDRLSQELNGFANRMAELETRQAILNEERADLDRAMLAVRATMQTLNGK